VIFLPKWGVFEWTVYQGVDRMSRVNRTVIVDRDRREMTVFLMWTEIDEGTVSVVWSEWTEK